MKKQKLITPCTRYTSKQTERELTFTSPTKLNPTPPLQFIEVKCETSGEKRRFAIGTEAGFATSVINSKLGSLHPAVYIEAIKEGEEPITFGPTSPLVDYGQSWTLHTVIARVKVSDNLRDAQRVSDNLRDAKRVSDQAINTTYIGKIMIAFILIFILGAGLTLVLENVPRLIELINSTCHKTKHNFTQFNIHV